jgi:hypothetical protein
MKNKRPKHGGSVIGHEVIHRRMPDAHHVLCWITLESQAHLGVS